MNYKIVRNIGVIACIICISTSIMYFITRVNIPGLTPFSLSVLMLSLVYSTKQQFDEGKVSKEHLRFIRCAGTLAGVANLIVGILQIFI